MPKTENARPGQWWRWENKRLGYYRCMRECYGLTAQEALTKVRAVWDRYPAFAADPAGTLAQAIGNAP
jgi:hypothetical protein